MIAFQNRFHSLQCQLHLSWNYLLECLLTSELDRVGALELDRGLTKESIYLFRRKKLAELKLTTR